MQWLIVPTLSVVTPWVTLRVTVTQSVERGIATQSVGTINR